MDVCYPWTLQQKMTQRSRSSVNQLEDQVTLQYAKLLCPTEVHIS